MIKVAHKKVPVKFKLSFSRDSKSAHPSVPVYTDKEVLVLPKDLMLHDTRWHVKHVRLYPTLVFLSHLYVIKHTIYIKRQFNHTIQLSSIMYFMSFLYSFKFAQEIKYVVINSLWTVSSIIMHDHPVGWGCRIHRLHFCRGVPPPRNEAACWSWVATRKTLGRIPGGWAVIDPATEWSMACNTPLWPLLGLTGGRIGPDPINRLVMSSTSTYIFYPDRTLKSALVASSQPLSVKTELLYITE